MTVMGQLLHGSESRGCGDQAYKSQGQVIRARVPLAREFTNRPYKWKYFIDEAMKANNRTKSRLRSRVAYSIGVIKRVLGLSQGALSRVGEERRTGSRDCGAGQHLFSFDSRSWDQSGKQCAKAPISEEIAPKSEPTAMNEPFQIHRSAGNRPVVRTFFDPFRPATAPRCLTRDATAGRIIG